MTRPDPSLNGHLSDEATRRGLPPHILWAGIIIALMAMSLTICIVTIVVAVGDRSAGVEPDYYTKALAWDETLRQEEANERLGWSISATTEADDDGRQRLVAVVLDSDGAPVAGAAVRATAFHRARVRDRQELMLLETEPGRYAAPIRIDRAGLWELRFTVERGEDTFTYTAEHLIIE